MISKVRYILPVIFFLLLIRISYAQKDPSKTYRFQQNLTGIIEGIVIDSLTFQPVSDVEIEGITNGISAQTNADGTFHIDSILPGKFSIRTDKEGYKSIHLDVIVEVNKTTELKLTLIEKQITISEIDVIASRELGSIPLSVLDAKLRPMNTTQDMLRVVPGLFLAQHTGGGKAEQIFLRGFDCDHGTDLNISVDG